MQNIEKRITKINRDKILWIAIVIAVIIIWAVQACFGGAGELKIVWTIIVFTAIIIVNIYTVGGKILKSLLELGESNQTAENKD